MKALISIITISFITFASASAQDLPQGKWTLASYNFKKKIAFPIEQKNVMINIQGEGKLGGRSGCNVFGGGYSFENGKLKMESPISTMMACDEMTMEFEQAFLKTLADATEFSVEGYELTLTDKTSGNILRFRREKALFKCGTKTPSEN